MSAVAGRVHDLVACSECSAYFPDRDGICPKCGTEVVLWGFPDSRETDSEDVVRPIAASSTAEVH